MLSEASHCLFCSPGSQILTAHLSLFADCCCAPTPLSFPAPYPALTAHVQRTGCSFPPETWFLVVLCSVAAEKTFYPWFKHRNSECNPGRQEQLWMMPSSTIPPQSSLQGHGELTLPAAISAWAHPLHKSLLFSFPDVLTLYMHLHVFSQRNSISTGFVWHSPFNSFKQYLFDWFGAWPMYLGRIHILSLCLCFRETNYEFVTRKNPPKQAHISVWHSAVGSSLFPLEYKFIDGCWMCFCGNWQAVQLYVYAIKNTTNF